MADFASIAEGAPDADLTFAERGPQSRQELSSLLRMRGLDGGTASKDEVAEALLALAGAMRKKTDMPAFLASDGATGALAAAAAKWKLRSEFPGISQNEEGTYSAYIFTKGNEQRDLGHINKLVGKYPYPKLGARAVDMARRCLGLTTRDKYHFSIEEAEEKLAEAGISFHGENHTPLRDVWRFLRKMGEDELKTAQGRDVDALGVSLMGGSWTVNVQATRVDSPEGPKETIYLGDHTSRPAAVLAHDSYLYYLDPHSSLICEDDEALERYAGQAAAWRQLYQSYNEQERRQAIAEECRRLGQDSRVREKESADVLGTTLEAIDIAGQDINSIPALIDEFNALKITAERGDATNDDLRLTCELQGGMLDTFESSTTRLKVCKDLLAHHRGEWEKLEMPAPEKEAKLQSLADLEDQRDAIHERLVEAACDATSATLAVLRAIKLRQ